MRDVTFVIFLYLLNTLLAALFVKCHYFVYFIIRKREDIMQFSCEAYVLSDLKLDVIIYGNRR
jgi:hypothetical protein